VVAGLAACGNDEVAAVSKYKEFLEKAKPHLAAMTRVREDLFNLNDLDRVLPIFRDDLLPRLRALGKLAREQPTPTSPRLAEIHGRLCSVVEGYTERTLRFTQHLDKASSDEERERALVVWGEDDQKFGKEMQALVDELKQYLDTLTAE
jgi:hypothetical protein